MCKWYAVQRMQARTVDGGDITCLAGMQHHSPELVCRHIACWYAAYVAGLDAMLGQSLGISGIN